MFQKHSQTSKNAYKSHDRTNIRDQVYRIIVESGRHGITGGWIAQKLNSQNGRISARLIELQGLGLIYKLKATSENPSGVAANLYISDQARPYFLEEQIEKQKKSAKKANKNEFIELLKDIESRIALGVEIFPESEIHKKIKDLI